MSKNDKNKSSGGLLESWFGRPKTKGRTGTLNGRPISSESDTIGEYQDLSSEIMALTVEEIDQKFIDILEDMNIPKDKRQPLLKKSFEEKRDMILMHFKGSYHWTGVVLEFVFVSRLSLANLSNNARDWK